jgi:hypothetical protein
MWFGFKCLGVAWYVSMWDGWGTVGTASIPAFEWYQKQQTATATRLHTATFNFFSKKIREKNVLWIQSFRISLNTHRYLLILPPLEPPQSQLSNGARYSKQPLPLCYILPLLTFFPKKFEKKMCCGFKVSVSRLIHIDTCSFYHRWNRLNLSFRMVPNTATQPLPLSIHTA